MSPHRPRIAVTGPDTRFPIAWWFIRWGIWRAGGVAIRMTPQHPQSDAPFDGIIVSGGDDIDPRLYLPEALDEAGDPTPETAPADPARDAFEVDMLTRVLPTSLPLLGICRGAQLLNVVQGGNLHADVRPLRKHTSNRRTPFARKTLQMVDDSRLTRILGHTRLRINSLHHQAVDTLGASLTVVGRDRDGLVQAIEDPTHPFRIGVQWHPEYLPLHAAQRRLFAALVNAARRHRLRAEP